MRKVVVIAASVGGVGALRRIVAGLPAQCSAAVLIVLHIGSHPSALPAILRGSTRLPVVSPAEQDLIRPGHVYVAPSDHHMLVGQGRIRLNQGPKVRHSRPAADPLFESAARAYGQGVMGVVLTGWDGDGAQGLRAVKEGGGIAIVQDPQEAIAPGMPLAAIAADHPDACLALAAIADRGREFCAARPAQLSL